MPDEKEIIHEICYFRDNREKIEEQILRRVRQMLNLEYDSLANQLEEYKAEQKKAIDAFKDHQNTTLESFREELINYFKDKFEPNFTQSIFEMNKALVEKVVNGNFDIRKYQLETEHMQKEKTFDLKGKKVELWKAVLIAALGAFGIKLLDIISKVVK